MATIPGRLSARRQAPQAGRTHQPLRTERSNEEKARHLTDVRPLTRQYARMLRARAGANPRDMQPVTQSLLGLREYTVYTKPLQLQTHGHQRDVFLDMRGRYWVKTGLKEYGRRNLEDFETWELRALARLLEARVYGTHHH